MVFTYLAPLLTEVGSFTAGAVAPMLLVYGRRRGASATWPVAGWQTAPCSPSQLVSLAVLVAILLAL